MRHAVVWPAQVIEPDPNGEWVRYAEFAELKSERDQLQQELACIRKDMDLALDDARQVSGIKDGVLAAQERSLKLAKERLLLLGHSANCASRRSGQTASGAVVTHPCNCGLDAWMRTSGL